jgi:2-hydroxycyclohexanecarboxyl-CoA dehydrogenase
MPLAGKVAVVSGAARGLERAIALKLSDDAAVSVWDLDAAGVEETTEINVCARPGTAAAFGEQGY